MDCILVKFFPSPSHHDSGRRGLTHENAREPFLTATYPVVQGIVQSVKQYRTASERVEFSSTAQSTCTFI